MKLPTKHLANKMCEKAHVTTHVGYLTLVAIETTHFYGIVAGVLAVTVIGGAVLKHKTIGS